jgi:hypothetical protein
MWYPAPFSALRISMEARSIPHCAFFKDPIGRCIGASSDFREIDPLSRNTLLVKYTQIAYISPMKAIFIELPPFARHRSDYLDDESFLALQASLMVNPEAGDVIEGTGGLRKLRHADPRRGKGKRGGLRVIYYWWDGKRQFWLFTLYDKDEMNDLSPKEKKILKDMLKRELESRR